MVIAHGTSWLNRSVQPLCDVHSLNALDPRYVRETACTPSAIAYELDVYYYYRICEVYIYNRLSVVYAHHK